MTDRTSHACSGLLAIAEPHKTRRRLAVLALATAGLGLSLIALGSAPAAADTVTSPTGMVTLSVPPNVVAGVASTYTLTVTNTTAESFDNLAGVVVSGVVPPGMSVQHLTGCSNLGGNKSTSFLCSVPNLAPGASETATFSILASANGSYQLSFGASALEPDGANDGGSDVVGDSVTATVSAQSGPTDIQVSGSSNNGSPPVGSVFNYTFQVKNNGPLAAGGVTFDDQLPTAISLAAAPITDNGSCTANTDTNSVHCDIGNLAVGSQSDITLTATASTTGVIADTATIAMTGADTHPANNTVAVSVQPR
jgi:uncharacterized repeat protein (TIGR01451 family)